MTTTTETGADAVSIVTFCGRPLSKTLKSPRCNPEIIRPSREKTSVETVTSRTGTWMVGICCAPSRAARLRATTAFPSRVRTIYCLAKAEDDTISVRDMKKRVPEFRSEDQERAFWATH